MVDVRVTLHPLASCTVGIRPSPAECMHSAIGLVWRVPDHSLERIGRKEPGHIRPFTDDIDVWHWPHVEPGCRLVWTALPHTPAAPGRIEDGGLFGVMQPEQLAENRRIRCRNSHAAVFRAIRFACRRCSQRGHSAARSRATAANSSRTCMHGLPHCTDSSTCRGQNPDGHSRVTSMAY